MANVWDNIVTNAMSLFNKSKWGDSAINTTYNYKGTEYKVYKDSKGKYYYVTGTGNKSYFNNSEATKIFNKNYKVTVTNNDFKTTSKGTPSKNTSAAANAQIVAANPTANKVAVQQIENRNNSGAGTASAYSVPSSSASSSSSSGSYGAGYSAAESLYADLIKQMNNQMTLNQQKINELSAELAEMRRPKSAQEIANHYGIDYNEQHILNELNQATEDYYKNILQEQDDLRTNYVRNNGDYYDRLIQNYADSYGNTSPTVTNRGALAANILSYENNVENINNDNDYGMLQNYNYLNEARKAELANNPYLAKQKYNDVGKYLSSISTNLNASDVQQYVDTTKALSDIYAADRTYQGYIAQANAAKYAGLAGASSKRAAGTASTYSPSSGSSSTSQLYTLYNTLLGVENGNQQKAGQRLATLLESSRKAA